MSVLRTFTELPRAVRVVFFATFVNRVGTMALPFLLLYLTKERHYTPATAGAILGLYGAGALLAGPIAGWLVNRVGARVVMITSLCASAAILLSFQWVPESAGAILVFAWALTGESFRPACAAVVAEQVPPEKRRSAYAMVRLAVNLGMTIGPVIGGLLAERSYAAIFVVDGATSLAAAGTLLLPAARSMTTIRPVVTTDVRGSRARSAAAPLALHLFGVALVAMVAYQALSTMPLYMTRDLGLGEAAYGFIFGLSGLIIVLLEVPLTLWFANWSHRKLLVCGAALTGLGFGAFAVTGSLAGIVAATLVWTTGEMLLGPATAARVADLEPAHRRGVFVGLHNAVWSAAFALGPWLGMQTFTQLGSQVHWLLVGVTGIAAAAVFGSQRSSALAPSPSTARS